MRAAFSGKLGRGLAARFTYDRGFYFALGAAAFAAAIHTVWLVTNWIAFRRQLDAITMVIVDWDPSIDMWQARIGLILLISVAGLLSRRVVGLFLSTLALAWVVLEYYEWYAWSMRLKSNAGIEHFPLLIPHAANLYGATPWNVMVLVLVIAVLLWEIGKLFGIMKSQINS